MDSTAPLSIRFWIKRNHLALNTTLKLYRLSELNFKRYKMPAKSKAQNRLMQAVANDPKVAKKLGIPQSVGKEYASATKKVKGLPEKVKPRKK